MTEILTVRQPRRLPFWLADLLILIAIAGVSFAQVPGELAPKRQPETLVLMGAAVVLLLWRRRWPIPTLCAMAALFATSAAFGIASQGLGLAVAVATFEVANRTNRRTGLRISMTTVVVIVALSLVGDLGQPAHPRVVQFALTIAAAAAMGDATRSRREYIDAVTERAERAEQTREAEAKRQVVEERLRIARDLHDVVAHQIAVISLNAGVASSAIDARPARAREALTTIRGASRTVLSEIGDLLQVLRASDEVSPTAPHPSLGGLDQLATQFHEAGLEVTTRIEGDLSRLSEATGVVAYRVAQEALTNAHKHGTGHRAHVFARVGERTVAIVVTNPMAESHNQAAPGSGLGLTGLRERVATVRGSLEAGPGPGGWRVSVHLPLTKENSA